MVQKKATPVSAFAVSLAAKGDLQLPTSVSAKLAQGVENLHSDVKLKKKTDAIAANYERNLLTNQKKKQKKKAERHKLAALARQEEKRSEIEQLPQDPLSWYDAPKSGVRLKFSRDESAEGAEASVKKTATKRGKRGKTAKKPKGFVETRTETEAISTTSQISSVLGKTNKRKRKADKGDKPVEAMTSGKKTLVAEWKPPRSNKASAKLSEADLDGEVKGKKPQKSSQEQVKDLIDSDEDSCESVEHEDPTQAGEELFSRLLHPHDVKTFMKKTWLKRPMHIKRRDQSYYEEDDWFSTSEFDRILAEEQVRFGVNIDLATYRDGKRETHNPAGRAYPSIVWDHYQQGCSVRLLNPQTYNENVWRLLSTLQEMFGCMVGANVYLTPPGTQGFAPHYDDIEAFVLQLEGKKHWKVYGPRHEADIWPLTSSPNMTEEGLGKPVIDCVLEPGDLLYFPRGAIHQAMAQDKQHSLHITVSTHQKNSWSDLLNLMLPAALANATENDPEFRESLPNDYLNYTGIAFQEQEVEPRQAFMSKVQTLMEKLMSYAPVDGACDLMAKKFIHDSLPPFLNHVEKGHTVAEQGEKWVKGEVRDIVELEPDTSVRLIRKHSVRIVNESADEEGTSDPSSGESVINIYYNTDNDRLYHGNELQYFEVDSDLAPAIEFLQTSFPQFVTIDELPIELIESKMDVATELYNRGLLITEEAIIPADLSDVDLSGEESSDDQSEELSSQ